MREYNCKNIFEVKKGKNLFKESILFQENNDMTLLYSCILQLYVVMVISELLVNQRKTWRMGVSEGELKCVSEEDMALSVMRDGVIKMLLLFADNLDFLLMVCALGSVEGMYLATSCSHFCDACYSIKTKLVFSLCFLSVFLDLSP